MRALAPTMLAAAACFAVGWSSLQWLARPSAVSGSVAPSVREESGAVAASPDSAASATVGGQMEAIAKLCEQPASMARDHALAAALLKLDAADFLAGSEAMLKIFNRRTELFDSQTGQLANAWMDRWLEIDATGALHFLGSTPFLAQLPDIKVTGWQVGDQILWARGGIFQALARRQPQWLSQALAKMKPGSEREIALYALMSEVARGDPARSRQLLASFAEAADRPAVVTGYVTGLVASDIRSSFDAAWAEPPGALRLNLLRLIFRSAGKRDASTTRELLDRIDDPAERRRLATTALNAIGFEEREDALPFIMEESERMAETGGWKAAEAGNWARAWARAVERSARGPHGRAIAEWAAAFAPDTDRRMLAAVAETWAGSEPAAFQSWLGEHAAMLDAAAVKSLDRALLANIASGDLAAARAWSETLPPGALRDQARFQVALTSGAEGDIAHAAAAYRSVAGTDTKGALARQLAEQIAQKDGAAAADWAMSQPKGPARVAALAAVAEVWSARDPVSAARWIETLPAGKERDTAVRTYATRAAVADPESAARWAGQVADPALRIRTAETVFQRWHIQNPVAARAWLRSLPGMEESRLAKSIRNTR